MKAPQNAVVKSLPGSQTCGTAGNAAVGEQNVIMKSLVCCQHCTCLLQGEDADTATDAADASDTQTKTNDTAAKPAVTLRKETRSRKKTFRVPLTVGGPGFAQSPMSAEQLKVC